MSEEKVMPELRQHLGLCGDSWFSGRKRGLFEASSSWATYVLLFLREKAQSERKLLSVIPSLNKMYKTIYSEDMETQRS